MLVPPLFQGPAVNGDRWFCHPRTDYRGWDALDRELPTIDHIDQLIVPPPVQGKLQSMPGWDPDREWEFLGVERKTVPVHAHQIVEREGNTITIVHHRIHSRPPKHLAFPHPGLRLEEGLLEVEITVEPCLRLPRCPGNADEIPRPGAGPPDKMILFHKPESCGNHRQLAVPVDIAADNRGTELHAAVFGTLHHAFQALPVIEPNSDEQVFRGRPHACDIRERDGSAHPSGLPVGHAGDKIRCAVEHVGRYNHLQVTTGNNRAIIRAVIFSYNPHHDLQELAIIHLSAPPYRVRSCTP